MAWTQQISLALSGFRVIADRGDWGAPVAVPQLADGKPETSWTSGAMDLRVSPANLFVVFDEPTVVTSLELDTTVAKNTLRVTDFEVYGRAADGWVRLGQIENSTQTRQRLTLTPMRTRQVRIRLRDNAREGHSWAVVTELRLAGAPPDTATPTTVATPVPDETVGERLFVATALAELPVLPRTVYDPDKGYLHYVRSFVDTLLASGTDIYGSQHSPMFVSLLLLDSGQHARSVIPSMPGQRIGDRALFGGNLQHDLPLLLALPHLSRLTGDARYERAGQDYQRFFLEHCTATPTGLWPWGEHAHWDFFQEQPGHTLHEYLGAPPLEFLEFAWSVRPQAVVGEADGMLNHIRDFGTYQFCRHAEIDKPLQEPRQAERKGLDFPRHGGMFLRHWAFTYSKTHNPTYLGYCSGMMRHFTLSRQKDGTLPVLSETSDRSALGPGYGCNLSVGVSLLEAAPLLGDTPAGRQAHELGGQLLEALAAAPTKPPRVAFAMAYGSSDFAGADALLRVQAYRLTRDERHLQVARAFAETYATVAKVPSEGHIRAQVYGVLVNLYLDLAALDGDARWLRAAEAYARGGIEDLYCRGLFRGATNLNIYDSELYISTLVYGLVRLADSLQQPTPTMPSLYFHR